MACVDVSPTDFRLVPKFHLAIIVPTVNAAYTEPMMRVSSG